MRGNTSTSSNGGWTVVQKPKRTSRKPAPAPTNPLIAVLSLLFPRNPYEECLWHKLSASGSFPQAWTNLSITPKDTIVKAFNEALDKIGAILWSHEHETRVFMQEIRDHPNINIGTGTDINHESLFFWLEWSLIEVGDRSLDPVEIEILKRKFEKILKILRGFGCRFPKGSAFGQLVELTQKEEKEEARLSDELRALIEEYEGPY